MCKSADFRKIEKCLHDSGGKWDMLTIELSSWMSYSDSPNYISLYPTNTIIPRQLTAFSSPAVSEVEFNKQVCLLMPTYGDSTLKSIFL